MTVIPFAPRAARRRRHDEPSAAALVAHFAAPAGGRGRFAGWYRLESWQRGQDGQDGLAACGVFTGTLEDAQGRPIAVAARRTRTAATAVHDGRGSWIVLEPVEVELVGFVLAFPRVVVAVDGATVPGPPAEGADAQRTRTSAGAPSAATARTSSPEPVTR